MQVPKCSIMFGNSRNVIFRVSMVYIAVLPYAAMQCSMDSAPGVEWVPITVKGSERSAEIKYLKEELRNDNGTRWPAVNTSIRIIIAEKASRTESAGTKKRVSSLPSEYDLKNETLDIVDQNALSKTTLKRLRSLLACREKDFYPQTVQRGEFWVLKNFVRADHGVVRCHETITYTTHASLDFLDNVLPVVKRWMAPVSLAIHAPGADMIPTVDSIRYLRDCSGNDLVRRFVTFHVFFNNKHIPSVIPNPKKFLLKTFNCSGKPPYVVSASTMYTKKKNLLYPINVARNVARDAALTHFILASDIELYPSPNLIPRFLNMIARNAHPLNNSNNPRVFPIRTFEVAAKVKVPSTKTQLQFMLAKSTAVPFHTFLCPRCHNIPEGRKWFAARETKRIDVFHVGKRQNKFVHWEPFFVGTNQDPQYEERLSWEGMSDKMLQCYILCVQDYDFMILSDVFLFHKPGIKLKTNNGKRNAIVARQNALIKNVIMPELNKLYGTRRGCAV